MVNEKQNKVYEPVKVYDRKLVRSMLKADIVRKDGLHNVNSSLHKIWRANKNANGKGMVTNNA